MEEGEQVEVAEEQPVEETPEPQAKTFTQEEVDELVQTAKEQGDKQYQGLQRVISKKDKQIGDFKKAPQPEDVSSIELMLQMARGQETQRKATGELGDDPVIPQLEAEVRKRKAAQESVRIEKIRETVINEEKEKLETRIIEAGFDPNDERFEDTFEMWELSQLDGKFERATRKLERELKSVKPPEEKVVTEKEATEAKRQEVLEKGQNKTDGTIAGSVGSDALFKKQFASGELPLTQANIDRINKILDSS